jgi:S-DNA-T family DNA segregation ATPase FtsK/SpoIIIE
MPSRIAFAVTSGVDSRTILDMNGAEKLLGKGDMLYFPQGFTKPLRVQGAFVPDEDVSKVVDFIKKQNGGEAEYDSQIQESIEESTPSSESGDSDAGGDFNERDQYFADAGRLIIDKQKGSIGMLQRNFKIGFNRAARIMDQLEEAGVVGAETGTKPRTVMMTLEQFNQYLES